MVRHAPPLSLSKGRDGGVSYFPITLRIGVFLLLLLAGCDQPPDFSASDQLKSLALLPQEITVRDLDENWRSVNTILFLERHCATLIPDPNEQKPSPPKISIKKKDQKLTTLYHEWEGLRRRPIGSATPISNDGYFLTAYHAVDEGWMWITNVTWPTTMSKNITISCDPIRVVFKSEKADFAIIKSSFKTPHYLKFRKSPLKNKELLFGGGLLNSKGAGYYEKSDRRSGAFQYGDHWFHELVTSIPLLGGDSGSPVIDSEGRLCGIVKSVNPPLSFAVILRHDEIKRIIEKDRAANKLVDRTPVRNQP